MSAASISNIQHAGMSDSGLRALLVTGWAGQPFSLAEQLAAETQFVSQYALTEADRRLPSLFPLYLMWDRGKVGNSHGARSAEAVSLPVVCIAPLTAGTRSVGSLRYHPQCAEDTMARPRWNNNKQPNAGTEELRAIIR
jgi:hypothetical protein